MTNHKKIAISLPAEDLALADHLAESLDRSRSWVMAEALRQFGQRELRLRTAALDPTRSAQLLRDLQLTPTERVREGEHLVAVPALPAASPPTPRQFATYDDFVAWRDAQP